MVEKTISGSTQPPWEEAGWENTDEPLFTIPKPEVEAGAWQSFVKEVNERLQAPKTVTSMGLRIRMDETGSISIIGAMQNTNAFPPNNREFALLLEMALHHVLKILEEGNFRCEDLLSKFNISSAEIHVSQDDVEQHLAETIGADRRGIARLLLGSRYEEEARVSAESTLRTRARAALQRKKVLEVLQVLRERPEDIAQAILIRHLSLAPEESPVLFTLKPDDENGECTIGKRTLRCEILNVSASITWDEHSMDMQPGVIRQVESKIRVSLSRGKTVYLFENIYAEHSKEGVLRIYRGPNTPPSSAPEGATVG